MGEEKGLSLRALVMIGVGGIIGSGIFLASGQLVRTGGPAVLLAFGVGGLTIILVMSALAEMAAAHPAAGALRVYAREVLGPFWGFTTGWMYWTSNLLSMASEVTAAALLTRYWLPRVPPGLITLVYLALMVGLNLLDARGFGRLEGWMSMVKIAALVVIIGAGLWLLFGRGGPGLSLYRQEPFFATGLRGLAGSLLLVMFTLAGSSVVAMAAAESRDPAHTVPRAVRRVVGWTLALYLGSIFVLLGLVPWHQVPVDTSPFVALLDRIRVPAAASLLNAVALVAALSCLNSQMYAVARMLFSLAKDGEAPALLGRLRRGRVPANAVLFNAGVLLGAVLLNSLLPGRAFLYLVSMSSFVALGNWLITGVCHLRYRRIAELWAPGGYRMAGYPWSTYLALALVLLIAATAPLVPGQIAGLAVGAGAFTLWAAAYGLRRVLRARRKGGSPAPLR